MSETFEDMPLYPKELSWLAFNERVLQEAANAAVPELQRLRYLGIFSNNMDEFFRVRVADVSRLAAFSKGGEDKQFYRDRLTDIQTRTRELQQQFEVTYKSVLKALNRRHIYIITYEQFNKKQGKEARRIFFEQVLPELDPVILKKDLPFPKIEDGMLYLIVKTVDQEDTVRYGVVEVPSDRLSRFVQLPPQPGRKTKVFAVLEDIILYNLPDVFRGVIDIKYAEAYVFKLTRDAELELDETINQSLVDRMAKSVKKRSSGEPERLVYEESMPEDMLSLLTKRIGLGRYDSLMPGGRYHNSKDFIGFPSVGPNYIDAKPMDTVTHLALADFKGNLFDLIRQKDVLLYYPYHSFDTVIDLLKTAAIDPAVTEIKICLYRAAEHSRIVDALLSARRNLKNVTVVVELQARFDEANNIAWANQLTDGGVNVIFGVPGLKVHTKLIAITRKEDGKPRIYTHIGSGNFNEKTAKIYTDFSLLTRNKEIGKDVANVFDFINYTYRRHAYKHLMVSPLTQRSGLVGLIENEISNAKLGKPAEIIIKCNNLTDKRIIAQLYEASKVGVSVRIICRGMTSIVPGIKGVSENIEAISIVDKYLEHPRVYVFHNDGDPKYFISSADMMNRNIDYRVEVSVPVCDEDAKQQLQDVLDIQWCDNVKARVLDAKQSNTYRQFKVNGLVRSQEMIHQYLSDGVLPTRIKHARERLRRDLIKKAKERERKLA
ncbi:MAG: polyphosphate kinase 1 [Oleiphilaceae bacterium]|nr:polyphosphate kinase 1 [Oleiphilaceae bacterium]